MAQYNINLRTESHISETWKVVFHDLTELRNEMARFVGQLLKEHAELIWTDEAWRVDVTDESGLILYVLNVSAKEAPATLGSTPARCGVDISRGLEGTAAES